MPKVVHAYAQVIQGRGFERGLPDVDPEPIAWNMAVGVDHPLLPWTVLVLRPAGRSVDRVRAAAVLAAATAG